jgi:tetratricopeptide (TPR) repeat protein
MRRWILVLAGLVAVIAVVAAAAFFWNRAATDRRVASTISTARTLLEKGRPQEAMVLFHATKPPDADSANRSAWFDLEVAIALANRQFEMLGRLRERDPDAFAKNPEAVAWVERIDMTRNGTAASGAAAQTAPSTPLLSADKAILAGDPASAKKTLESAKLEGKDEVNRLTRLALLEADNQDKAWDLINQAYAIDPRNADVRTFAGNILEQKGAVDLARRDYVAAVVSDPANPRARDNLAEFYIRQGMLPQAVKTWQEAPPSDIAGIFYLKAWFWNRVGLGNLPPADPAAMGNLVATLAALPPGDFWSTTLNDAVAKSPLLADREETLWLRVLQELREGQDSAALRVLLGALPGQTAHHAFLKTSLQFLLEVRMGVDANSRIEISDSRKEGHPFWQWFAENKSNPEALRQPWVVPTLLCVSGWPRAGVDVCKPEALADAPEWAAYALARSAQIVGDNARLGDFLAATRCDSPAMKVLRGEAAWTENRAEEGRTILEGLLGQPEAGYRSAFLLSMYYLNQNKPGDVRRVLAAQPDFAESVAGREFLARAALGEGKEPEALAIYESLGDRSDDARIYLARHAFQAKDWDRAEALVRSLIADHPNEPAFLDNLNKIAEAKKAP